MKDPRGLWEARVIGKYRGFLVINLGRNFPQKLQEVSKPVGFSAFKNGRKYLTKGGGI